MRVCVLACVIWNLKSVIKFHFSICSLVVLPSPVLLLSSFSAFGPYSPAYFKEISFNFLLEIGFFCVAIDFKCVF